MTQRPSTPPPGRPGDRRALAEAFKELVKSEAEKKQAASVPPSPPRKSRIPLLGGIVVLALAALLVARPAWLFPAPPQESPAIKDASYRLLIYREAMHIEDYRRTKGALPATLAEAGGGASGVVYTPVPPDGYSLSVHAGPIELTYSSAESIESFLGNSYQLVKQRSHQ